MLGFDFGTIGFHAKSAAHFMWLGFTMLRAEEDDTVADLTASLLQPLAEHSHTIDSLWWA